MIRLLMTVMVLGASPAMAQAQTTPEGQVYQIEFNGAAPVYGGTISFSFGDYLIDSYTETGIGGADQPGGTGSWSALGDGQIRIEGDPEPMPDPGDPLPPRPALQLLASGQSDVTCETWPVVEIGDSPDPASLCWITNSNILSVTRTQ